MNDQTIEAEPEMGATDYHRRMLKHVKNCGLGFIDNDPQPLGILIRELTDKIAYNAENFGDLLGEAIAARDDALVRLHASVDLAQSTEPTTGTALATIRTSLPTLIAADKDDLLGKLKAEIDGFEPDTSTKKGREQIASIAMKPRRVKAAYKKIAASLKEDAQVTIKSVNAEDKQMSELLDGLAVDLRRPLDEIEAIEAAIERDNEAAIKTLEDLAIGLDALTADEIKQRYLTSRQPFPWAQTFAMRADRTLKGVIAQLQVAHQAAKAREAEAEQQRISAHKVALTAMDEASTVPYGSSAETIRQIIHNFTSRPSRGWDEFEAQAVIQDQACLDHLHTCLNEAIDIEAAAQRLRESEIAAEATRLAEIEAEHRRQKDAEAAQALLDTAAERERVAKELAERLAVAAENSRVTAHRSALAVMAKLAEPLTSPDPLEVIRAKSVQLQDIYENRQWEEFSEDADKQLLTSGKVLANALKNAIDLASKAEVDRKEAQRGRDETARLAQEEAAAANLKAALEAERQRVADEKAAEEQALADRMKRRKHVEKINDEAISSIVGLGFGHDAAKFIVESIARHSVAHVSIAY